MNQSELAGYINLGKMGNVADALADKIKEMIISGKLPPGFRFANENQFCEQLGVGRSTLREAYKTLESNRYIVRTKRGTRVNDLDSIIAEGPFDTAISMADFNDMLEFRAMFEEEIAGLAAKRATRENLESMRLFMDNMIEKQSNLVNLTFYDMQFHMEIAKASQNKLLINTMHMASDAFSKGIYNAFLHDTAENIQLTLDYHESILRAIERHDSQLAKKTMRAHLESALTRIRT